MNINRRNHYTFGLGTIGRDMLYTMTSMFLIVYLTEILNVSDTTMWWIGGIFVFARIFDAVNDPIMGAIVDSTDTRWGKFKPWITAGALSAGLLTILLFTDFGLKGTPFIILFGILYLLWGITFTMNDIAYWSMLPALTTDQKEREKIGSFAKVCASIGLAVVVVGILPITGILTEATGSATRAWQLFTVLVVVLLLAGQSITIFGIKEPKGVFKKEEATGLKALSHAIFGNDQLIITVIALVLFQTGYVITTSFGVHFFKYAYGNEGMYPIFAGVVILVQIIAMAIFPAVSKKVSRGKLYTWSTIIVLIGYVLFFLSPMNIVAIGISAAMLFLGQGFINVLMLMFLADTVEYGQWKLGKRNEAATFALQPFIFKLAGAISAGVFSAVLITSGINKAETVSDVTIGGLLQMKLAMLAFPPLLIIAGYLVYRRWYKIDEEFYTKIIKDLKERGDLVEDGNKG